MQPGGDSKSRATVSHPFLGRCTWPHGLCRVAEFRFGKTGGSGHLDRDLAEVHRIQAPGRLARLPAVLPRRKHHPAGTLDVRNPLFRMRGAAIELDHLVTSRSEEHTSELQSL